MRKSRQDFEEKRIPLDTVEFEREIGSYSPTRRVPVLLIDDLVIWDSLAICEYINENYAGGQLWPARSDSRALARSVAGEMHSGFSILREMLPMNIRARDRHVDHTRELEQDISRISEIWRQLLSINNVSGPWLFGSFSIADAFYIPVAFRFQTYGINPGAVEMEYMNNIQQDPDVREWVNAAEQESEIIQTEETGYPKRD